MYRIDLTPEGQKFPRGTIVRIKNELPSYKSHFERDKFAIVEYSYYEQYRGGIWDLKNYSINIQMSNNKWSRVSWYYEDELELVEDIYLCKEIEQDFLRYKNLNKEV